jgi:hypothetical protein
VGPLLGRITRDDLQHGDGQRHRRPIRAERPADPGQSTALSSGSQHRGDGNPERSRQPPLRNAASVEVELHHASAVGNVHSRIVGQADQPDQRVTLGAHRSPPFDWWWVSVLTGFLGIGDRVGLVALIEGPLNERVDVFPDVAISRAVLATTLRVRA